MLPFAIEMMLLGFISLLLAATSRIIAGICIDSKYYSSRFSPCTKEEVEESINAEHAIAHARKHLIEVILHHSLRRNLEVRYHNHQGCPEVCNCFNFQSTSKNLSISNYCTRIYITFASFFRKIIWCAGTRVFCFAWRSGAAAPVYICDGCNSCDIQLFDNVTSNTQGAYPIIFLY